MFLVVRLNEESRDENRIRRIFDHCRAGSWSFGGSGRQTADRNNKQFKTKILWSYTTKSPGHIYEYNVKTEESLVDSNNIGKFYDHVNKKLATKSSIGVLKNDQGSHVTDPAEQAEVLNSYFATPFVDDNGDLPAFPSSVDDNTFIAYIAFNSQNISKLNKLRVNSACGPDSLPPLFLKRTSKFISRPLSLLFESSFLNAYIPPIWKEANVKPIHKKGNVNSANNYRPISLTCSIAKVVMPGSFWPGGGMYTPLWVPHLLFYSIQWFKIANIIWF